MMAFHLFHFYLKVEMDVVQLAKLKNNGSALHL
jgi:hypothetical protein